MGERGKGKGEKGGTKMRDRENREGGSAVGGEKAKEVRVENGIGAPFFLLFFRAMLRGKSLHGSISALNTFNHIIIFGYENQSSSF